ncbi:sugar transferase [Novosphingobium sp. Fuku2-ISO-50]|uniref:sugar transferase n=1 Tax=Novosphingobium sp. Fuku2-ISO-50 TaxID=1739114 RepID=UPI001E3C44B7|nr:sugar transferase [Novosphingobium sp. Fuku2-ISO-50]
MTMTTNHAFVLPSKDGAGTGDRRRFTLPLGPSLERRRLQIYLALMAFDAVGIAVAFLSVGRTLATNNDRSILADLVLLFIPVYWAVALSLRLYSVRALTALRFAQLRVVYALFGTVTTLIFMAYLAHSPLTVGRLPMGVNVLAAAIVLVSIRSVMRRFVLLRCGPTAENVLIIDDGGVPVRLPGAWTIKTREHNLKPDFCDPHMLDRLGLFMTNMDRVLVSCEPERRAAWAMIFKGSNVSGEIVDPDVHSLGVVGARRCYSFGTLVVSVGPLSALDRAIKRAMDIATAGSALLFMLPLLICVAILIRVEDGGPVFFLQQRQGRNNRLFWIYKFRSMRVQQLDLTGTRSASRDDERVTRIGRIIRRTSIDELPQLINVLRGNMSVVGPRPHAIGSLAGNKPFWEVDPRYLLRHSLKPGLTGLAQVRGLRGATDTEIDLTHRLQADLEYLDGWTVLRDVKIILGTIKVLFHDKAF